MFPNYERYLEHSPNLSEYRQLYSHVFSNPLLLESSDPSLESTDWSDKVQDHHHHHQIVPEPEDIVLSGDDLVVEYVDRLSLALIDRSVIPSDISTKLNQFLYYKVWSTSTLPGNLEK